MPPRWAAGGSFDRRKIMIKQSIPSGWLKSPAKKDDLDALKITYKIIVTDWIYRNKHAQAVETVIISESDFDLANLCAAFRLASKPVKKIKPTEFEIETHRDRVLRLETCENPLRRAKLHKLVNRFRSKFNVAY
jgi:hypothetical protein